MRNCAPTCATTAVRGKQQAGRRIRGSSLNWPSSTVEQKVVTPDALAPGVFLCAQSIVVRENVTVTSDITVENRIVLDVTPPSRR
ncbi:hypothetical protein AWB80_02551 [Caballeronia pedi]|uniref:Uncharacterized protein n=1 Tax=Caballeronia pedi TaxID=1777141 RepID=A0A158AQL7_9BURK|nr:hypothetical protein AWB80_02551 [Caballeronia pedi]